MIVTNAVFQLLESFALDKNKSLSIARSLLIELEHDPEDTLYFYKHSRSLGIGMITLAYRYDHGNLLAAQELSRIVAAIAYQLKKETP
jgi:hypothetical protein